MTTNISHCIALAVAAFGFVACERAPEIAATPEVDASEPTGGRAPPLVVPGEDMPSPEPPSYEVSIASAAANHNNALERCSQQPEAVRTQCEQEANAAFAETEASLAPLRGNQQ
jgi:hypothetical protein